MDKADYIEHCELLLNDREFYEKLNANPTLKYAEEVKQKIGILINNYKGKQEYTYLAKNLENPRAPLFYKLPKIHKIFDSFLPLQLLLSGSNPYTCNLLKSSRLVELSGFPF